MSKARKKDRTSKTTSPDKSESAENLDVKVDEVLEIPIEEALEESESEREIARLLEREDQLLRQLSEKENQVRRMSRDLEFSKSLLKGDLAQPLLDVLDDLSRALDNCPEGVDASFLAGLEMVAKLFAEALDALGITVIEALGRPFDPQFHEALLELPGVDAEKGTVIQEIQKGYILEGRVLRASKVAVAG